jgi:hypothetical protein
MLPTAHSAARSRPSLPTSLSSLSISAVETSNLLGYDEFTELYDQFAATAVMPGLAYTNCVTNATNHGGESECCNQEEVYDLFNAVAWPGQGTNTREDSASLPLEPNEDSYYLQFGDLTSNNHSVGGNERCWVEIHGRKVKAIAAETYSAICRVTTDSGSVEASKIILHYGVTDYSGNLMGYVSSGRVTSRFTGWKPNDFGIGPGIPAAASRNECLFIILIFIHFMFRYTGFRRRFL